MEETQQSAPKPESFFRRLSKKRIIIVLASAAVGAAGAFVTGDIGLLAFAVGVAVLWAIANGAIAVKAIVTLLAAYVFLGTPPVTLNSSTLWRYPFQRAYIALYSNIEEPEWFPDFQRDVKGGYEFDYSPSIMQGTGHYSVYFETDEETLKKYSDEFSAQAKYTFTLEEYYSAENVSGRNIDPPQGTEREESEISKVMLYIGGRYEKNASAEVTVYVLSSNLESNHPHTSAVFIDKDNSAVFLSQLG